MSVTSADIGRLRDVIQRLRDAFAATGDDSQVKGRIRSTSKVAASVRQCSPMDVAAAISGIRSAFLNEWHRLEVPQMKALLAATAGGLPTPALTVCGRGTEEIRFTKYLGYFLDPSSGHGLGARLLEAVFAPHARTAYFPEGWYHDARVHVEYWLEPVSSEGLGPACRCDIVVISSGGCIFVEQKILSGESDVEGLIIGQLDRYKHAIDADSRFAGRRRLLVYLTPQGLRPVGDDWSVLSHDDLIRRGLSVLSDIRTPLVARENLRRLLMDLAIGPYRRRERDFRALLARGNELLATASPSVTAILQYRRSAINHGTICAIATTGV